MQQRKDVLVGDIAESLNVNEVFDVSRFSRSTGVSMVSSPSRINKLIADGLILVVDDKRMVKDRTYVMTDECKKRMIIKSIENIAKRGKAQRARRNKVKATKKRADKTVICESILRKAGLM